MPPRLRALLTNRNVLPLLLLLLLLYAIVAWIPLAARSGESLPVLEQPCGNGSCSTHFGPGCGMPCAVGCLAGLCNSTSGVCCGCARGYLPPDCSACDAVHWGTSCEYTCGAGCVIPVGTQQSACNVTTGECFECAKGFLPPACTQCNVSHWGLGVGCSRMCPSHCLPPAAASGKPFCNQTTGDCFACVQGRCGPRCELLCENLTAIYLTLGTVSLLVVLLAVVAWRGLFSRHGGAFGQYDLVQSGDGPTGQEETELANLDLAAGASSSSPSTPAQEAEQLVAGVQAEEIGSGSAS
eukprot:gnl/Hemi2/21285_TR7058_c0_g1_i1.p1 gnl/Hemi2/21285_TR7058_c0_g1~~gnl/Hemi2/21285_TR7058_c0_g1_i1.p1  ORF type:complete len:310 (+),score=50.61 gnl/Hemi2/21285_TR7058_c0_g1_i1:45-932(+)